MSRFFAHTPYAEDQPLSHTILTVHVLTRAVTTGTIIGMGITGVRQAIPSLRRRYQQQAAVAGSQQQPLLQRLLASTGRSTLITMGVTTVLLAGRMYGRDLIEWQDRSWRLMENRGQLECDDWTYGGMGLAAVAGLIKGLPWTGLVGAVGLGSFGGMVGYMGWRYGVHQGKFPAPRLVV